jgi:hypothetical protein
MSSNPKRATTNAASPLEDAGTLSHVLTILGPGHHLFISAVSKAWRESYKRVASVQMQMTGQPFYQLEEAVQRKITSQMTLCSAVFASDSRVRLAHECGLTFGNATCQRIAGRIADVVALWTACQLGLELSHAVLSGAAEAASVPKLRWLHTEQDCMLPAEDITYYAARSGSIDTLLWLRDHGCVLNAETCEGAAAGAHVHVIQFLRSERCVWGERVCSAAAKHGHFITLKWLRQKGCSWDAAGICGDAAQSGSIEMLRFLKQQGCEYNTSTFCAAAGKGHLAVCQFLLAEQCPWHPLVYSSAAIGGHLETLRFLHESGCPWDAATICRLAAAGGNVELLRFLKQHGAIFDAHAMRTAAGRGDTQMCQYLRAEQCPWDEEACESAASGGHVDTLRWLHEQGCPWRKQGVRLAAAHSGCLSVILYVQTVQPARAGQLQQVLNSAGTGNQLAVAQWARQQGADWPVRLHFRGSGWGPTALQWARREGCTSYPLRYSLNR